MSFFRSKLMWICGLAVLMTLGGCERRDASTSTLPASDATMPSASAASQ